MNTTHVNIRQLDLAFAATALSPELLLTPAEQKLLQHRGSKQQHNFKAGRYATKSLLMEEYGGSWQDWAILPTASGQPQAFFLDQPVYSSISISHSRDHILCAMSSQTTIGVDIETKKPRNTAALIKRIATPSEYIWWQTQTDPLHAFYLLWTAKEAAGKARGTGLVWPLKPHESLVPHEHAPWLSHDNIHIKHQVTGEYIYAIATIIKT